MHTKWALRSALVGVGLSFITSVHSISVESLRLCGDPSTGIPPDQMPWLPAGADHNSCNQMIIRSALQTMNASDASDHVAAFSSGRLVGFRDHTLRDSSPITFTSAWDETGQGESVEEIWWGRNRDDHVLIGQESFLRLTRGNAGPNPAEMAALLAEVRRQTEALRRHLPPPPPLPIADASGLFLSSHLVYEQIGGTHATFSGGYGGKKGEGPIPPGAVSNAVLKLDTTRGLAGEITFDVGIDGATRSVTFPVMANTSKNTSVTLPKPEEKFRLRAAASVDGRLCRCEERPSADAPAANALCDFPDSPQEHYELYGAFFGDHARLVGLQYQLVIDKPGGGRRGATATGIIILRAK